jgi:hypothetical protein
LDSSVLYGVRSVKVRITSFFITEEMASGRFKILAPANFSSMRCSRSCGGYFRLSQPIVRRQQVFEVDLIRVNSATALQSHRNSMSGVLMGPVGLSDLELDVHLAIIFVALPQMPAFLSFGCFGCFSFLDFLGFGSGFLGEMPCPLRVEVPSSCDFYSGDGQDSMVESFLLAELLDILFMSF